MGPFIGISSTGVLLAILAVVHRNHRLWFILLMSLAAFMGLFGVLSSWSLAFGEPGGMYRPLEAFQGAIAAAVIVSLVVVVAYLVILLFGLRRPSGWVWSAIVTTAAVGIVSGSVPAILSWVVLAERSSSWIRVIINAALLAAVFTPQVRRVVAARRGIGQAAGKAGAALALALALLGAPAWQATAAAPAGQEAAELVTVRVDQAPAIDGDAGDAVWKKAAAVKAGPVTARSVYTEDAVALLVTYEDPTLRLLSPDAWAYQAGRWVRQSALGAWNEPAAACYPARVELVVGAEGAGRETWQLLEAWQSATQSGSLRFSDRDRVDPCALTRGKVQLTGQALPVEGPSGSPASSSGSGLLGPNAADGGVAAPRYIETNPKDWADAMILTRADVASGRAVPVAGLTKAQIEQAWSRYVQLHAAVPGAIVEAAQPGAAGLAVGATWENGLWIIEALRPRQAGAGQPFGDPSAEVPVVLRIWTAKGDCSKAASVTLSVRFDVDQPGLAAEESGEEKGGCYCRTQL